MTEQYLTVKYDFGTSQRSYTVDITETDISIAARRIAATMLAETPPASWAAFAPGGIDVTSKLAHVVRGVVYGDDAAEARFFIETLDEVGL